MKNMQFSFDLQKGISLQFRKWFSKLSTSWGVGILATVLAAGATVFFFIQDAIVAYGDAESHLNIAKRVVDSLTPGAAQLGGIWLPLPHVLLTPLVYFDFLWRSGLAGSIVSGIAFVVAAVFLFKLVRLLTANRYAAFVAALVFLLNPNLLYLQATPMTELPLIAFFILSTYFFLKYLREQENILPLVAAAFFGFCAALSRYDGWFLVGIEAGVLLLVSFPYVVNTKILARPLGLKTLRGLLARRQSAFGERMGMLFHKLEGRLVLFSTLAFFGIALWLPPGGAPPPAPPPFPPLVGRPGSVSAPEQQPSSFSHGAAAVYAFHLLRGHALYGAVDYFRPAYYARIFRLDLV